MQNDVSDVRMKNNPKNYSSLDSGCWSSLVSEQAFWNKLSMTMTAMYLRIFDIGWVGFLNASFPVKWIRSSKHAHELPSVTMDDKFGTILELFIRRACQVLTLWLLAWILMSLGLVKKQASLFWDLKWLLVVDLPDTWIFTYLTFS